ncbi:MFS transporter [Ktedonosporobacter rubrisoli]|uniref:MFS transporter n=1 Tax=Ktedonosporobacter rubrisoli TaxID=2509675 RepID=A0A4P6JR15_KTERU|nr:MFS transporter [Ktedonosporobacter rubrisoli]QBD77630.1 MFS transporter [Ktedonosporobacter rubrisoli]
MATADEVIQNLPWRWNTQGLIFVICGLGFMFDAWEVVLTGFVIPLLATSDWHVSKLELGLFGSAGLIGMAVGAFAWGSIADLIGRKRAFMYTMLVYSIFSLLCALAPTYTLLLIFRFIAGLGLGGFIPVDYSVVSEFTPSKNRGTVLTALDVWWPIGGTLCGLVATLLAPYHNWRLLFGLMALPALMVFWVRTAIPESPLYLIRAGRREEARAVVQRLIERVKVTVPAWTLPEAAREASTTRTLFTQFRAIWSYNLKITAGSWLLFMSNLLLYYGVVTWLPTILVSEGYKAYAAFLVTTLLTAIGIVGVLVSAWLVEVIGRRWVVAVGGVLAAISMYIFTLQLHLPTMAQTWILVFGFTTELVLPAIQAYVPELYPTLLRGTGFGWASTMSRVCAGLVPIIFGSWLWPVFGLANTFGVIGLFVLVSIVWMWAAMPETKGKLLDHVGEEGVAVQVAEPALQYPQGGSSEEGGSY